MLSAVILAKNEKEIIGDTIRNLSFADEVIVIDNGSTDKTAEIAKKNGAKVHRADERDFSHLRNKAMDVAKKEWILFIDADEIVSDELRKEIVEELKHPSKSAYFLRRTDIFWDREVYHGELRKAYKRGFIRLMRKGSGSWKGRVHEEFVSKLPVGRLDHSIKHYAHDSAADFLHKINLYSTLRAEELYEQGRRSFAVTILCFPCIKFVYTYFILGGFLDSAPGFVYSFMMSFHLFLVQGKIYLMAHADKKRG